MRPLTSVNIDHHHASGFDQAKELEADVDRDAGRDDNKTGRAGHSKLMRERSRKFELTSLCINSVTNRSGSRREICEGFVTSQKISMRINDSARGSPFSRRHAPEGCKNSHPPIPVVRPAIELMAAQLRSGVIVLCDNVKQFEKKYRPFAELIREPSNGFRSMLWPGMGGLEISVKP